MTIHFLSNLFQSLQLEVTTHDVRATIPIGTISIRGFDSTYDA